MFLDLRGNFRYAQLLLDFYTVAVHVCVTKTYVIDLIGFFRITNTYRKRKGTDS
jgi:hypothetical protein